MDKRCRPAATVLAICAMALTASPVAAQDRCSPVVEAELTKLGVEPSRRTNVVLAGERGSGEDAPLIAIGAWVYLKDCDGAVVIQMRPNCEFQQAYTTRSCKIQGVYHSC
jgi:hypothetical protein